MSPAYTSAKVECQQTSLQSLMEVQVIMYVIKKCLIPTPSRNQHLFPLTNYLLLVSRADSLVTHTVIFTALITVGQSVLFITAKPSQITPTPGEIQQNSLGDKNTQSDPSKYGLPSRKVSLFELLPRAH